MLSPLRTRHRPDRPDEAAHETRLPPAMDEPRAAGAAVSAPLTNAPETDEPVADEPLTNAPETDEPTSGGSFPDGLRAEAAKTPGGWAYEVDPAFKGTSPVPAERISRAWKIDSAGSPTSHFVANPHYQPGTPRGRVRRVAMAGLLILVAIMIAAVVVLLVSNQGSP